MKTNNKLRKKLISILLALSMLIQTSFTSLIYAQTVVVPDSSQGKNPGLDKAANGTLVVNIKAPNSSGLSHNQYKNLQIGQGGLIFNNSKNISNTQLAGHIAGNPNIGVGANRILNEVTGSVPTNINGYMEVAGQRADLIIANPNGIVGNNFGYINTNRAVLTTGIPQINNGTLQGFAVTRGQIEINGQGLDARTTSKTDIIANAVKINAAIHAQDLSVVTGSNIVDYNTNKTTSLNNDPTGVSLDIAALGGMYANSITLVGTRQGLGVNSEGVISATGGDITITQEGKIVLKSATHTSNNVNIKTNDTLEQTAQARLYGNNITIKAGTLNNLGDMITSPVIAARENLEITANQINNKDQAIILSENDTKIEANEINNNSSTIEAKGNLTVNATTINNTNDYFQTEERLMSSKYILEYQASGYATRYNMEHIALTERPVTVGSEKYYGQNDEAIWAQPGSPYLFQDQSVHLALPNGVRTEDWNAYRYTRYTYEDVIIKTTPAKLIAGQNMTITANTITNDKSQMIAGGSLNVTADTLNNIEAKGERRYNDVGTVTSYWRDRHSGRDYAGIRDATYNPADTIEDITLTALKYSDNTKVDEEVRKATDNAIKIPTNVLYNLSKDTSANFLIETDPAFTDYKTFLSSDYFLNQMKYDADTVLKRLGDGYYEQQLIKDQIMGLTGKRYVKGFDNDDEQYKALLDNAIKFANSTNAVIGVALTDEQTKNLTDNLVWLVEKEVMLPSGKIVKALVPQVYLADQTTTSSAVISGKDVDLKIVNDILNSGTIKAGNVANISATNINNIGGKIQASDLALDATNDINNLGGTISAQNNATLTAGNDVNVQSTTSTQTNAQGHTTNIGAVGTINVTGEGGNLTINAQNDVNITGGVIQNKSETSTTTITAQNNLNLKTVTTSNSNNIVWDAQNKRSDSYSTDVGSNIAVGGNLNLNANNDINAKAANVVAGSDMNVQAGGQINITAGKTEQTVTEDHKHTGKTGGGNKSTTTTHDQLYSNTATGSNFVAGSNMTIKANDDINIKGSTLTSNDGKISLEANNINITTQNNTTNTLNTYNQQSKGLLSKKSTDSYNKQDTQTLTGSFVSGKQIDITANSDINIKASGVIADNDVNLNAGKNINIQSGQTGTQTTYNQQTKKSGVLTGGGIGITIGKQQETTNQTTNSVEQIGSLVGSTKGNVNINAGSDVNVKASEIIADKNINIQGNNVNIIHQDNTYNFTDRYEYKQTGLTISLGGNAMTALNNIYSPLQRGLQVTQDRTKALYAIKTGIELEKFASSKLDLTDKKNWGIDISFGTTKYTRNSQGTTTLAQGSTIKSNADINITAREKDITISGSNISGNNLTLDAKENVNILASANTNTTSTDSSSKSASIGVSLNPNTTGLTAVNLTGSASKGQIRENGIVWNESTITATENLTIKSGKDTNIIGSQAKGETIKVQVGDNLNIQSLQDTQNYTEQNKGVSIGITTTIKNPSTSLSGGLSNQNIKSDYSSVQEQAGIFAGKGGFDITVGKNTDLKGAVIASEATPDKNKLTTGTLTYSSLKNTADWKADTTGININHNFTDGKQPGDASANKGLKDPTEQKDKGITPNLAGSDGKAQSTTKSAIAQGTIQITQNPDQDITDLSRDTENANNPLNPIFDKNKILENQEAAKIFGEIGFKLVGDLAQQMGWKEGSAEKIMLHGIIGGIMADINGGKFGEGLTVGAINEILIGELTKLTKKDEKGKDTPLLSSDQIRWISALVGGVVSETVGGNAGQGAGVADSATRNNYLTHEQEQQRQKAIEEGDEDAIAFWDNLDKAQNQVANIVFPGMSLEQIKSDPEKHKAVYETAIQLHIPTIALPDLEIINTKYVVAGVVVAAGATYAIVRYGDNIAKILVPASVGTQTILRDPTKIKLVQELEKTGEKFTQNAIVDIVKTSQGRIVWLEKGSETAGLQHILNHSGEFVRKGIAENQIPQFLMKAVSEGKIVGYQSSTRPIYEVVFDGKLHRVAITIGDNGFIVGANFKTTP